MSIRLDVYVSPYKPIPNALVPFWDDTKQATWPASSSSLLSGDKEAVLIDALITTEEATRLVDWIRAKDRALTTVYITHGHGDHFFGLNTVLAAFPQAKAVALPEVVPFAQEAATTHKRGFEAWFPNQFAENPMVPEPMRGNVIDLEGHEIRAINVGQSDTAPSTVVHVPDLKAVVGGDVAYNGIHCWLANTDHVKREAWLASLDTIASLNPKLLVAGHKDPKTRDDDPQAIIDATRGYIRDFDRAVTECATPQELIDTMMRKHGERGNPATLCIAANGVKDQLGKSHVSTT